MKCYIVPSGLSELFYPDRWLKPTGYTTVPLQGTRKKMDRVCGRQVFLLVLPERKLPNPDVV